MSNSNRLNEGEFWLLDAPGINGMGSNSLQKMQAHADAGGSFIHKVTVVNGKTELAEPLKMWPQLKNI